MSCMVALQWQNVARWSGNVALSARTLCASGRDRRDCSALHAHDGSECLHGGIQEGDEGEGRRWK